MHTFLFAFANPFDSNKEQNPATEFDRFMTDLPLKIRDFHKKRQFSLTKDAQLIGK